MFSKLASTSSATDPRIQCLEGLGCFDQNDLPFGDIFEQVMEESQGIKNEDPDIPEDELCFDAQFRKEMLRKALRQWGIRKMQETPLCSQSLTCTIWRKKEEKVVRDVLKLDRKEGEALKEFHLRCAGELHKFGSAEKAHDYVMAAVKEMPKGKDKTMAVKLQRLIETELLVIAGEEVYAEKEKTVEERRQKIKKLFRDCYEKAEKDEEARCGRCKGKVEK